MKLMSSSTTLVFLLLLLASSFRHEASAASEVCHSKCKCVPSGTYGNKDECPCYRDRVNSKGQSKCP
ncbi:Snakin-1 [Acorus calamus]|uniref:Snakin-1 n=1 Tax=Acorus calamus TaxID=4465 RepID=A0AAV9CTA2_ACOCL|nr:Snakin-1 [Acorus calamus]